MSPSSYYSTGSARSSLSRFNHPASSAQSSPVQCGGVWFRMQQYAAAKSWKSLDLPPWLFWFQNGAAEAVCTWRQFRCLALHSGWPGCIFLAEDLSRRLKSWGPHTVLRRAVLWRTQNELFNFIVSFGRTFSSGVVAVLVLALSPRDTLRVDLANGLAARPSSRLESVVSDSTDRWKQKLLALMGRPRAKAGTVRNLGGFPKGWN